MSRLPITMAFSHYDHVADLMTGRVPVEGVDLTFLELRIIDVFFRFLTFREFDVSEISMAKYVALRSQGDDSLIAIPVFPSRVHRHSCIYIRKDGSVTAPGDLAGKRVGVPEWAETAVVYARGFLQHQYGVDLASIDWVQAGVDQPGRTEKVTLKLPPGLRVTPMPEKILNDMLLSGEIDAIMSAHVPLAFAEGDARVGRLFENYFEVEQQYSRDTGIFPIMHTVAMRKEVAERNPWLATNLYTAFEEAKRRSIQRALASASSVFPIPWWYEHARKGQELFGEDYFAYGIEKNRVTLDAFLDYALEQGVLHRKMTAEELFAPQVQKRSRL